MDPIKLDPSHELNPSTPDHTIPAHQAAPQLAQRQPSRPVQHAQPQPQQRVAQAAPQPQQQSAEAGFDFEPTPPPQPKPQQVYKNPTPTVEPTPAPQEVQQVTNEHATHNLEPAAEPKKKGKHVHIKYVAVGAVTLTLALIASIVFQQMAISDLKTEREVLSEQIKVVNPIRAGSSADLNDN